MIQTDLGVTLRILQRSGTTVVFQIVVGLYFLYLIFLILWGLGIAEVLNTSDLFPNRLTEMRPASSKAETLFWPHRRRMCL